MSHFSEMDWNAKWDWENIVGFGSKVTESPKKQPPLLDWMFVDDGEIDGGSFNLSTGCGNSGASSAKSSLSASTDSSVKPMTFEGFSGNLSKKREMKGSELSGGISPHMVDSIGSVEPLIGLKLGRRTYFENCGLKSAPFPMMPTPSTTSLKKTKSSGQNLLTPSCSVEGCSVDLSMAKDYHRKHRVCDSHSKCPKVIVGGLERRFCQQCSRFHNLSEFDEKKRSCRRRLSDHNARRRKPRPETIQYNSASLASPYYGGRQKTSFLLNNAPLVHSRNSVDTITWDSLRNSKFTITKGYPSKSTGDGDVDEQMQVPGIKMPHANMHFNAQVLASKSSIPEVFNPGSKGSLMISSQLDAAAPAYRRALSLLSNNFSLDATTTCGLNGNDDARLTQPTMHAIPQGVPLSSSEFWLTNVHQSTTYPRLQSHTNFPEIQLLVAPYEAELYSNILN